MPNVEVLCARLQGERQYAECTSERWNEAMSNYSDRFRHYAANMAAHSYDVLVVDERVMLVQPSQYNSEKLPEHADWLDSTRDDPQPVDRELLTQLYEPQGRGRPHKRLFDLPDTTGPWRKKND